MIAAHRIRDDARVALPGSKGGASERERIMIRSFIRGFGRLREAPAALARGRAPLLRFLLLDWLSPAEDSQVGGGGGAIG